MPGFIDTFWTHMHERMSKTGWVIDRGHRYEPTELSGLTPSGKAFDLVISPSGDARITVAGRTREASMAVSELRDGSTAVTKLLELYERLPPNQR